ncbi:MAG: c-type cytochrome domain-containing protein [Bacteroidota bacterium]
MPHLLLSDFGLFVGRFHPLLVHLPIGFLLLAALLEWWPGDKARTAIRVSWVVGAVAAVAAAFCGWLLAGESGGGDTLFWHKWLGISVAVLAIVGVFLTRKGGKMAKGFGLLIVGLLSLAGHQGGNLTHGEDYLFEHAPPLVQRIAGHGPDTTDLRDWSQVNTDSINLYATFLRPAIKDNCARCHNDQKQNGDLRMDEAHFLFEGGDGGPILLPGNPLGSEWLRRVTLPRDNVKAMPPQGQPWDYATIALLEYWINEGADTLAVLNPKETPEEIKTLLQRDYGLDLRPRLFVEKMMAPAVSAQTVTGLQEANWSISELLPGGPALEAKPTPGRELEPTALNTLAEAAADQIAYLSLDRLPFTDEDLAPLTKFKNLNRLRLNGTNLTITTVEKLTALRHLESLNLYGTTVDDEVFAHLANMPKLKRVYLWQTKVSAEAAAKFAETHPTIEVDTGFQFAEVQDQNSSE